MMVRTPKQKKILEEVASWIELLSGLDSFFVRPTSDHPQSMSRSPHLGKLQHSARWIHCTVSPEHPIIPPPSGSIILSYDQ